MPSGGNAPRICNFPRLMAFARAVMVMGGYGALCALVYGELWNLRLDMLTLCVCFFFLLFGTICCGDGIQKIFELLHIKTSASLYDARSWSRQHNTRYNKQSILTMILVQYIINKSPILYFYNFKIYYVSSTRWHTPWRHLMIFVVALECVEN